jgi:hypothetical protein
MHTVSSSCPAERIEQVIKRTAWTGTRRAGSAKTDSERSCFLHVVYGGRWDDPRSDAVFDAGKQTIERSRASDQHLRGGQIVLRKHPEHGQVAGCGDKVKAGIATNPRFFIPTLDVFYDGAMLVLRGITHSAKEHKAIEEAARALAQGLPVRCELHYRK